MNALNLNNVFVIAGLMVLAILFLMTMLARLYRKAGPHEALVVYGFRGTRIVKGRGTVIFPLVENPRLLSLELMSFDVAPKQDLYTRQGVAVTVEAVAQIKVKSDPNLDPDGGRAVSHQDRPGTRGPDPAGDGRPSARHHRPTSGRRDCQAARDGRRPHALHLRRRHEQNGPRSGFVHHQGSPGQERLHHQHGTPDVARIKRDAEVAAAEADRDTAIRRAEASANPLWRRRRPTRPHAGANPVARRAGRSAARSGSEEGAVSGIAKQQQAQADKAYDIQTNIMQQQVVAEQVKIQQVEKQQECRCRTPKFCAWNGSWSRPF